MTVTTCNEWHCDNNQEVTRAFYKENNSLYFPNYSDYEIYAEYLWIKIMSINWVRTYNRLFEIINSDGDAYFSGGRFISKVKEVDPYFHNYLQYIEQRKQSGKSTSRKDYFYDILLSFNENQRLEILNSILGDVRDALPDKVSSLEQEMGYTQSSGSKTIAPKKIDHTPVPMESTQGAESNDPPTYMYHENKAPKGQISKASEVPNLEKVGWVDSPDKFGNERRSQALNILTLFRQFWLDHWKWIIGTIITIAAVVVSYING